MLHCSEILATRPAAGWAWDRGCGVSRKPLADFSLDAELSGLGAVAPAGSYLGIRIRQSVADMVVNSYPEAWQQRYRAMSYRLRDPVVAWGLSQEGVMRWRDLEPFDTAGIFADARRHGLVHGVVVSAGDIAMRTIGGFARADRDFTAAEMQYLHQRTLRLHHHARQKHLTQREIEALRHVATGKSYALAAYALRISESALKARLATVRRTLGARTMPEAVHIAQSRRLI